MLLTGPVVRPTVVRSQFLGLCVLKAQPSNLKGPMSTHYAHARAPAEAQRIQTYLDAMSIPLDQPIHTKALVEAVFAGEEERNWCARNISSIAKYLDGYHVRGVPFQRYGRTCRAYFWHSQPDPELSPVALEIRINQLQASLDRIERLILRIAEETTIPIARYGE